LYSRDPCSCPPAVRGLRPRPRGLGRRALRAQALVGRDRPRPLRAFGAPAGCIRARPHPPPYMGSRRFRTSGRVFLPPLGRYDHEICSSRRNAPRGPISSRSRNLRCAAVSRGLVRSCNPRGRCGGFAAPGTAAAGLCCGPQYAAIWRSQATASSRRLAALATRPSATAPRRLEAPRGGFKSGVGGGTLKTQNSYFFRGLVGISRSHRGPVEKLSVFSSVSSLCLCGSSVCDRQIRNPKSEIRNFFGWACRPMLLTPCVIMRGPVEVV